MITPKRGLVTFDPDEVFLLADLAPAIGVTRGAARSWVNSHLAKGSIPAPLFSLSDAEGRATRVWTSEQGTAIVALYVAERAQR